jgi:4-amino-4-deoxy-L-arabinose transferase-like glycosyltransferase
VVSESPARDLLAASPRVQWLRVAVVGLLLLHAGLLAWAATRHSPVIDEPAHLVAGIAAWQLGRFDLYQVNPPLVRMLATLPVLAARPQTDWTAFYYGERPEFMVGRLFINVNGDRWFWYFMLARWACIPLSLLGGYVCWRWAAELYGPRAGLLALALWCFCPNVLAYGQLITSDAGAAALGVTAAYAFWRWLKAPTVVAALLAGVALGLAELTKMTWVVLFLLWPLLWVVYAALRRREPQRPWPVQAGQLVLIPLLGLGLLNFGYGFDGSLQPLGSFRFSSRMLTGQDQDVSKLPPEASRNRFAGSWLANVPVPVPRSYLQGIDLQKLDFERQPPSYLRGEWQRGGWWYYYLYALAVKVPLGTWLLLLLVAALKVCRLAPQVRLGDELVVMAPLVVVLAFVSSATGMNSHMRYVLPALPFAFIWISQVAQARVRGWAVPAVAAAALGWSVASSLWVYPHSLSYFNELAGGPANGHAHLVDSNIDWGQDLFYLKRWLEQHPEARPLNVASFSPFRPSVVGIESGVVPKRPDSRANEVPPPGATEELGPRPGWFAVSVTFLRSEDEGYAYFLQFRPVAMAGYSIYIYHLSLDDANRARRQLGLDELPGP